MGQLTSRVGKDTQADEGHADGWVGGKGGATGGLVVEGRSPGNSLLLAHQNLEPVHCKGVSSAIYPNLLFCQTLFLFFQAKELLIILFLGGGGTQMIDNSDAEHRHHNKH